MLSVKIIYALILVNVIMIFSFTASNFQGERTYRLVSESFAIQQTEFLSKEEPATTTPEPLVFQDTFVAYHLLQQLDVNSTIGPNESAPKKFPSFFGLEYNDNYCEEHRAYFVSNPEFIFEENNFMSDFHNTHLLRTHVIPSLGVDVHKDLGLNLYGKARISATPQMRLDTNLFFTQLVLYDKRIIGKHFSCLTQSSNHIPGFDILNRKDLIGEASVVYTEKYASKPHCFNNDKFFPKTWVLTIKEQCDAFFAEFNSPQYETEKVEKGVIYIRKIGAGAHEASGIFPVDDNEEQKIREAYKNGSLCGKNAKNNVMQSFIHNPLLLKGRKFDFGIFLLVASSNPIMAYYHDGYLRVSLNSYDPNSKQGLLTNIAVSEKAFGEARKKGGHGGMTLKQVKEETYWTYTQLHEYLMETGVVSDPDWLDNYLRPEMKKALIHLMRMSQGPIMKKSSLYKLYGLDFMLDDNLNLWFIEANARPGLNGWMPKAHDQFTRLLTDAFEIVSGLLRSRTKRIINYINKLTVGENGKWVYNGSNIEIDDLELKRREFDQVSQNRFEPEYEPSLSNGFQLIIDENYEGVQRYQGLISEECL